jgi:hypothetical protein
MRKILGVAVAGAVALMAGSAFADSETGPVSNINKTANTFQMHGRTFTAGDMNVVGVKVSDLEDGKTYRITYSNRDAVSGKSPINVMTITPEQ